MDFDHRDGEKKWKPVSQVQRYGLPKTMAELAKCDLVCSNCHRLRTERRRIDRMARK